MNSVQVRNENSLDKEKKTYKFNHQIYNFQKLKK